MNSATSIRSTVRPAQPDRTDAVDPGFRPWHFFVLASLAASTAAVVMSRRSTPEHLILISLTIIAAGAAAAGFYRMLAPFAADDVSLFSEPLSDREREAYEREKALVLRSIKELEFDRAMGKLSQKDFDEMAGRLRGRAIAIMKQLDEPGSAYRAVIERDLAARLAKRGKPIDGRTAGVVEAAVMSEVPAATVHQCACGTTNEADAVFCKRCGARLASGAHAS
jgi:hypothetical protein